MGLSVTTLLLALTPEASGYDAVACAIKDCMNCTQPHPAEACLGGLPPSGDCVCYTDFTLQFKQKVHLTAFNIDKSCGGGRSGFFIIRKTDWTEAYSWDMGDPVINWVFDAEIDAGTYRLEPSAQWGGDYCVEYWSGPPNCSGDLTVGSSDFDDVNTGNCSAWKTATFKNNGNMSFSIGGIISGHPAFQLDLSGIPGTLDPGASFTFKVRFCAPGGLINSTPYSAFITVNYTCNSVAYSRQLSFTAMAHVPRGELSVPSTFDVGSADWTLPPPGNQVTKNLNIENTGDAAMTVTVTMIDDAGGVFSFPSGSAVGNINGSSSKNLAIRATVTAEATYTGEIRVVADYGGGYSDSKTVQLQALGHHPVPRLHLYTTDIDYGEVEIDYSFHQAIKIGNDGDAPLTFDIALQDPADPDVSEFTLDLGPKGPIAPGSFQLYEMTYHPTTTGNKDVVLVIDNTNEEPPTSHTVNLHGMGTDPIPLSTMLVTDRSGSMDGKAGDVRKIEAASMAGTLYSNLVRDTWDWLGITKYNQNNSTPIPLAAISTNRAAAQTLLNDITGELLPDGSTCIGGAMQTAAAQYSSSPAANASAMILLTDGKENVAPWIADVKDPIFTANPNLRIYCVGIGDPLETDPYAIEGIEVSKFQEISEHNGAFFQVFESLSGENRYALEAFYFKVFAAATGQQIVLDPLYVLAPSPSPILVTTIDIVTSDRSADFLAVSDLFRIKGMEFRVMLQDPTGQIMESGAAIGGISVHVKSWGNCKLVRVKFPPRNMSDCYAGTWKVYLQPVPERMVSELTSLNVTASMPNSIPIAVMASVGSDYRLQASLTPGEVLEGQPIHIIAQTSEAWWPNPEATVTATVTKPDGSSVSELLYDDGQHNDGNNHDATFGLDFTKTSQKGVYTFLIRSMGVTDRGESVTREALLTKYVGSKIPPRPTEEGCLPCWLLRLIFALILLLLLLILILIIRCCCRKQYRTVG